MKSKIEEFFKKITLLKDKGLTIISENRFIISIFVIIYILLAFQHGVIGMYYDDYGNASLSYATDVGVVGTDYNASHIVEWSKFIYNNWGGRILYAICFVIPLLSDGITAYMITQSFVILGIIYFMYKIIKYKSNSDKKSWLIPLIIFALYSCLNIMYLRSGIYWASASVLYVWPLLPLFAFIYLYMKVNDKIKSGEKVNYWLIIPTMTILNFFATFSQEQVGVAVIAFEIFYVICCNLKELKKHWKFDLFNLISSIIFYLVLFLAPGNWVRMDGNDAFSSLSFFGKIANNFPIIINNIFLNKMNIYIYLLSGLMIYISYKLLKNKYKENKKWLLLILPIIISVAEIILMVISNNYYNTVVFCCAGTIWLVSALIVSMIYFGIKHNNIGFCSIYVVAACSTFCLLMSPSLVNRTFLPCIFCLIIIVTKLIMDVLEDNSKIITTMASLLIIVLCAYGLKVYIHNYIGYRDNYAIFKLNTEILNEYTAEEYGKVINLYKVEETLYGSEQPYIEPSMEYWIKQYFDIAQDVQFNWIDIYQTVRE